MKFMTRFLLATAILASISRPAEAGLTLGTAGDFAVLAGSTVVNTGSSYVNGGNIGVSSGTSITGFLPGSLATPYTFNASDALAIQAHQDLATGYNAAVGMTPSQDLTGQDLGGMILRPGVYLFGSSAELTGTLTLDDMGDSNAQFIFQIGSTLTTASDALVRTINSGATPGNNVFWQVGSSATLGTGTGFEGSILAATSITLATGATMLDGSALALNGAVTLDSNLITNLSSVPEPSTFLMVLVGLVLVGGAGRGRIRGQENRRILRKRG